MAERRKVSATGEAKSVAMEPLFILILNQHEDKEGVTTISLYCQLVPPSGDFPSDTTLLELPLLSGTVVALTHRRLCHLLTSQV